jgi:hypothetical protein
MRRFLPYFLLPLALAVIGPCTGATRADQRTILPNQPGNPPIEGVLTNEGAQCPALRAIDGTLYTLMGDLHGFKPRDRVCVVPDYTDMTYCLQGTTAHVDWIGPGPCPGG